MQHPGRLTQHYSYPAAPGLILPLPHTEPPPRATTNSAMTDTPTRMLQAQRLQTLGTNYAGIAHDLSNLLLLTLGYVSRARKEIDPAHPAQRTLVSAETAAADAAALTRRVLNFSRPGRNSHTPMDITTVVADCVALLRAAVPKTIDIELEALPVSLIGGDRTEFQQIVMNLCLNAVQSIPQSQGVIRICIEPALIAAKTFVCMRIIDSGCGMDEATRASMFEPYFSTKDPNVGTGLGLTIVQQLVAVHGGRISVQSTQGIGTEFTLHFPALEPS